MSKGKYLKKREPVFNVAITMALVLFWLVILTTYMSAGLFAKYSTQGEGGDKARVIQFKGLTVTENDVVNSAGGEFIFAPGVDLTKHISVDFGGSEAATFLFVTVDVRGWEATDDAKPSQFVMKQGTVEIMNWTMDSAWTYLESKPIRFEEPKPDDAAPDGNRYVYYIALKPNTPVSKPVIADDKIVVNEDAYRADYAALADMKLNLDVTAYAVQANGFANAKAAWDSLSTKEVST